MLQKLPVIPDILRFFLEMHIHAKTPPRTATCKQYPSGDHSHLTGQYRVNSSVRQSHHIKQGELIGLGNISEQPQIVHKINDCLTDLGAVTEIILGQEFSLLCSLHHRLRSLVSHSVNAGKRWHQLSVYDAEFCCFCAINVDWQKLISLAYIS